MPQLYLTRDIMRKYQEMGFARHLILEAWLKCEGFEYYLLEVLLKIRSRDQLGSEQRLVWDGNRASIKRIVNQIRLTKLATMDYLSGETSREFRLLKKKGLLLKREFRGSRALDLKPCAPEDYDPLDIERLATEMKGYLTKLKHLSIKFDFWGEELSAVPLLRGIKHNFVGLVSLKLSLRRGFRLQFEDLYGFERLFLWLGPTLRHLDLDFAENFNHHAKFPEILGWILMKNLPKLETLCLDFRDTRFPISLVRFFINTACSRMPNLRSLRILMENCFLSNEEDFSQTSAQNNLQRLELNLDGCTSLTLKYLLKLQSDIIAACPVLEELFIRFPLLEELFIRFPALSKGLFNYSESAIKEEFLQKLRLKRLAFECSYESDDTWSYYQIAQELEREEEMRIVESACDIKQKAGGEEDFRLYCEALAEMEDPCEELNEQDLAIDELEYEKWEEMEEQDEIERILHGEATEQEWEILRENEYYDA